MQLPHFFSRFLDRLFYITKLASPLSTHNQSRCIPEMAMRQLVDVLILLIYFFYFHIFNTVNVGTTIWSNSTHRCEWIGFLIISPTLGRLFSVAMRRGWILISHFLHHQYFHITWVFLENTYIIFKIISVNVKRNDC